MSVKNKKMQDSTPDTEQYMRQLLVSDPLRAPVIRAVIQELWLPSGSSGLDAGCGIGLQAVLLAEAVGPDGHVTGLDISPEFLDRAQQIVERAGLSQRIAFKQGDVNALPFDNNSFDWLWSADFICYRAENPLRIMKEITRVVKPGGKIAVLVWSSQQLLPGYPRLEARMNATSAGTAPFESGMKPETHFLRALGWFRETGLEDTTVKTFVGDVHAPLSAEAREALTVFFPMRWEKAESELSREDWAEYQRLCCSDSPDFILSLPDYYAFFTYSVFCGKVPEQ
jgi:demethylmenaquinone methyltransferase/2-methoxy-6-polyprenyl-1,4-benzoquinol methylase